MNGVWGWALAVETISWNSAPAKILILLTDYSITSFMVCIKQKQSWFNHVSIITPYYGVMIWSMGPIDHTPINPTKVAGFARISWVVPRKAGDKRLTLPPVARIWFVLCCRWFFFPQRTLKSIHCSHLTRACFMHECIVTSHIIPRADAWLQRNLIFRMLYHHIFKVSDIVLYYFSLYFYLLTYTFKERCIKYRDMDCLMPISIICRFIFQYTREICNGSQSVASLLSWVTLYDLISIASASWKSCC